MSTVTVVPTVEAGNWPPRVRLDVTDTGSPEVYAATVMRLDPDGRLAPVRTNDGNPLVLTTSGSNRVGLVYDYEMQYGAPVSYSTLESSTVMSSAVAVPEERPWLVHPGVPALSMPLSVAAFGSRTRRSQRGVHWPMSRKHPVVQTDGQRKAPEGVIELNTLTLEEMTQFEALTDDASSLLLNVPAGFGWGVATDYVSVGDIEEARLVEYAGEPRRIHSLPYQVVDRPVGGSQAERTLVDLMDFPTLAAIQASYATLADVLAGP